MFGLKVTWHLIADTKISEEISAKCTAGEMLEAADHLQRWHATTESSEEVSAKFCTEEFSEAVNCFKKWQLENYGKYCPPTHFYVSYDESDAKEWGDSYLTFENLKRESARFCEEHNIYIDCYTWSKHPRYVIEFYKPRTHLVYKEIHCVELFDFVTLVLHDEETAFELLVNKKYTAVHPMLWVMEEELTCDYYEVFTHIYQNKYCKIRETHPFGDSRRDMCNSKVYIDVDRGYKANPSITVNASTAISAYVEKDSDYIRYLDEVKVNRAGTGALEQTPYAFKQKAHEVKVNRARTEGRGETNLF